MSWMRKEPDPLETRRRQLAEAERALLEQRRKLSERLNCTTSARPIEPPVWRMEDDVRNRTPEMTPARRRHLARQRQRDRVLFFVCAIVLLVVVVLAYWMANHHGSSAGA